MLIATIYLPAGARAVVVARQSSASRESRVSTDAGRGEEGIGIG